MKKLLFLAAAVAAMTFAACGNKSQSAAPAADSDSVATDTVAVIDTASLAPETRTALTAMTGQLDKAIATKDPKVVTTALANLEATYKTLVNTGKLDDAKTYGAAIKQFVNGKAAEIKNIASGNTTVADLVNGIANLPTTAETTAEQAKAAVSDDVVSLASAAIAKGASAKATAEEAAAALKSAPTTVAGVAQAAANAAATNAVNSANTAVQNAKTNAENKVNEKVSSAKQKANDAVNKAANKANEEVNKAASKAVNSLFK